MTVHLPFFCQETDRYSASLTRGANPSVTHMVFKGNDDSDSDNEVRRSSLCVCLISGTCCHPYRLIFCLVLLLNLLFGQDEAGTDIKLSLAERTQRAAATAGSAGISEEAQIEERQRALMIQKKAEYEARAKKGESRIPTMDEITAQVHFLAQVMICSGVPFGRLARDCEPHCSQLKICISHFCTLRPLRVCVVARCANSVL